MKKTLLSVIIATLSTFTFLSCGKEDGELVNPSGINKPSDPNNPNNPNSPAKCFISEISNTEDGDSYITKFVYNSKNLLETKDEDGYVTKYEYDSDNRITKMIITGDGVETFAYEYDKSGNITKVKYNVSEDTQFKLLISEFRFTTNTKGQVEKIQAVSEDEPLDFMLEYDAKNNIKKIIVASGPQKFTLLENLKFDDKSNVYINTNLSKAYLPHIIVSTIFGFNMTNLFNANNILSDNVISFFSGDTEVSNYEYGYTAEGYPSKMTVIRKYDSDTTTEEETYKYNCK